MKLISVKDRAKAFVVRPTETGQDHSSFVLKCHRITPWILKKHLKSKGRKTFLGEGLPGSQRVSSSDEGEDNMWVKLLGGSMCEAQVSEWGIYAERSR